MGEGPCVRIGWARRGFDRHPWAVSEANWTYRELRVRGRATQSDVRRATINGKQGTAIVLAYTVNELLPEVRDALLPRLLTAHARGARVLVAEPIARRTVVSWWGAWRLAFEQDGGRRTNGDFRSNCRRDNAISPRRRPRSARGDSADALSGVIFSAHGARRTAHGARRTGVP